MSRPARATHGDYGYARQTRCQCRPCRSAERAYVKALTYDHYRGVRRRKDPTEAREHVQRLLDAGCTYTQIANATGGVVFPTQVRNLMNDDTRWLFQHTIDALLKVHYTDCDLDPDAYCDPTGTMRRIQALQYMGHSIRQIGEAAGVSESAAYGWRESKVVRIGTRERVKEVYDKLAMVRGDNEVSRWRAYREGFAPPFAWDDETIDDPSAEPDWDGVVCVVEICSRKVFQNGLCQTHYYQAKSMRAFDAGKYYKPAVERLAKRNHNDNARLLADLSNLKELGYDAERAAWRLGRSHEYIRKVWSKA